MKKYILLATACCIAFVHTVAHEGTINAPQQDSIKVQKKKLNLGELTIEGDGLNFNMDSFDLDLSELSQIGESLSFANEELSAIGERLAESAGSFAEMQNKHGFYFNSKGNNQKSQGTPTRVEKKTYQNISEIEFFHKYGNIVVRESTSKQVELEIQYFDKNSRKASCTVSTTNKLLSISTENSGKGNSSAKVDYVISIPRGISLNIDLKYGDVRIDKFEGTLSLDLSYANLSAQYLNNTKLSVGAKYSDLKIGEVGDLKITASYSDINVKKVNVLETSGGYNDYKLDEVKSLILNKSSMYSDYKVGSLGNVEGVSLYTDLVIDNLLSGMNMTSTYGDVTIKSTSSKLKGVNFKGSYADLSIVLAPSLSATIDASLTYGDISVSKKYNVKYTQDTESRSKTTKKGQIGTGTPTASIVVTNVYADVWIK